MTRQEYKQIQTEFSALLNKIRAKNISGKRREGYELAILACKSIVSNHMNYQGGKDHEQEG